MQEERVLLVGSTEKSQNLLKTLLPPMLLSSAQFCQSGAEARRACASGEWSLVVINTPLSDESGLDLAMEFTAQTYAQVLMLVKNELAEPVAERMEPSGALVVSKPVARPLFDQALRFAQASYHRMMSLREENARLEKKLAEVRLVDRAKLVLMQTLSMSENQAHRLIEKQAMDTRQTRITVAQNIIATYEI